MLRRQGRHRIHSGDPSVMPTGPFSVPESGAAGMWRSIVPGPGTSATRSRAVAFGLALGVLSLELMLVIWVLFAGAQMGGSAGRGTSGTATGMALVTMQATTRTPPAHHQAKTRASQAPRRRFITDGPPAAAQPVIAPDPGAQMDTASIDSFEPLSGRHGAGDPCNLAQDLATDLQTNPLAQMAVDSVPEQSLSVARALLLWDGHWVNPDITDPGSMMLKAIILREIAAAKPECLAERNPGPQFLFVNQGARTVTIVIGSGQWSWAELAASQ